MNADFIEALNALQEEKNIDKQELIEAIESSIKSAYQKNYADGQDQDTEVILDPDTGEINVYAAKKIVDEVENPMLEISVEDARKIDPHFEAGDIYRKTITPRNFGRIAAQRGVPRQPGRQPCRAGGRDGRRHAGPCRWRRTGPRPAPQPGQAAAARTHRPAARPPRQGW